jgi:hypothetical protein
MTYPMTSTLQRAQARLDYFREEIPTRIDVRPDGSAQTGKSSDFFGADGATFRDVLDSINPLNHIPIVSDLMKQATGHEASPVSRLVGGALLGGPVGFIASLTSVIFENATGETPVQAVVAALTGDSSVSQTQLASAASDATTTADPALTNVADAATTQLAAPVEATQVASLLPPPALPARISSDKPVTSPIGGPAANRAVLDLYGNSPASVHASYKKMQMLPYLQDVSTSQVL